MKSPLLFNGHSTVLEKLLNEEIKFIVNALDSETVITNIPGRVVSLVKVSFNNLKRVDTNKLTDYLVENASPQLEDVENYFSLIEDNNEILAFFDGKYITLQSLLAKLCNYDLEQIAELCASIPFSPQLSKLIAFQSDLTSNTYYIDTDRNADSKEQNAIINFDKEVLLSRWEVLEIEFKGSDQKTIEAFCNKIKSTFIDPSTDIDLAYQYLEMISENFDIEAVRKQHPYYSKVEQRVTLYQESIKN